MKIKAIINGMMFLFLNIFNTGVNAADDWAQFAKYKEDNEILKSRQPSEIPLVIFMGNSITEGWVEQDPNFFSENNLVGRGISGQTTYQMLIRFREDVINLHPEIVVINAGTNDIAENNHNYDEGITFGNIVSMVELARANGISVILTSVLPTTKYPWRTSIQNVKEKVSSLNNKIQTYAENNGIPYVDYFAVMADQDSAIKSGLSHDGVHPTLEGYKVMEKIILPAITKMRNQQRRAKI